jgi:hypothetical protein
MSRLPRLRKPKLGLASAGTLMTPEEFDAVTDYDERYSLLRTNTSKRPQICMLFLVDTDRLRAGHGCVENRV